MRREMRNALVALALLMLTVGGLAQIATLGKDGKLRMSKLSPVEKALLAPALSVATGDHAAEVLRDFTAYPARLADRGPAAIVAISIKYGCGVNPNCMFLVFRETKSEDVPILNAVAGDYNILNTRHHGYLDLELTNYQGLNSMISVWGYDGHKYVVGRCTERTADGKQTVVANDRCGS